MIEIFIHSTILIIELMLIGGKTDARSNSLVDSFAGNRELLQRFAVALPSDLEMHLN